MNITVISVGKIKEKYFTAAIDEYSKRLSRFAKLNIIEVADEKIPDNASEKEMEQIKEKEGNKILAKLPQNSFVVTLCIEGKEHSSEELAKKIADISMTSSHITFIIGGSLGLSDTVKSKIRSHLNLKRRKRPNRPLPWPSAS